MMNSRGQRNLQAMESRQDGNQQKDQRELKRTKSWPLNQDNGVLDLAPPPEENEEPNSSYFSRRTTSSDCGLGASDINPFNTAGKGRALFTNGAVGSNNDTTLHRNVNNNSGSVAPLPPPVATTITMTSSGTNNSNISNNNSSNNINNNNRYSLSHLLTHSSNHLLTHSLSVAAVARTINNSNTVRANNNTQNVMRNSTSAAASSSSSSTTITAASSSNRQVIDSTINNSNRNNNTIVSNTTKALVSDTKRSEIPNRFDGTALSAATLIRPAGCGFTGHASGDSDRTLSSMCFKIFEGKVTSMAITTDGLYCIAAFSKGSIRLFDLTAGGNTDPEDRYGSYLGSIDANTTMQLHLELGGNSSCSHLFVGARAGSTKMFVVDMHSLRDIKRKRGFITMAGGNIKTFSHADGKLKGFCALSTVECALKSVSGDEEEHCYSARYRLVCGKGCGTFNVWDVLLDATYDPTTKSTSYSGFWSLLHTGSVGSPIMKFAAFVTTSPILISGASAMLLLGASDTSRSHQPACEVLIVGDKEARSHNLYACTQTALSGDKAQVKAIKGLTDLFASSDDGGVIFSGKDELIVTTYMPLSGDHDNESGSHAGTVYKRVCLPLIDSNTSNASKRNRQIREICGVSCNNSGTYALVHCTDNTVFLYSKCGYLAHRGDVKPPDGHLTLLFQAIDTYTLEMTINDLNDYDRANQSTACECCTGVAGSVHSHPTLVTLAFAWYLTTSGGGTNSSTLRTTRLTLGSNEQLLPAWLTVPGVGLVSANSTPSKLCWLCGDNNQIHWDRDACHDETIEEASPVKTNKYMDSLVVKEEMGVDDTGDELSEESEEETVTRKKKKPIETNDSISGAAIQNKPRSKTVKTGGADASVAALDEELTYFRHQVSMLEDQLKASQQEINLVIRKADRRFDDEKRLRKQWNVEKRSLLDEHERLQQELQRYQDADKERNTLKSLVQESANSLIHLLNAAGVSVSKNSEKEATPEFVQPMVNAPFCIVCQDYTANTVTLYCGHMCYCFEHAYRLNEQKLLKSCHLCKQEVKGICRVAGLDK